MGSSAFVVPGTISRSANGRRRLPTRAAPRLARQAHEDRDGASGWPPHGAPAHMRRGRSLLLHRSMSRPNVAVEADGRAEHPG